MKYGFRDRKHRMIILHTNQNATKLIKLKYENDVYWLWEYYLEYLNFSNKILHVKFIVVAG